jgi:hypothetical protein
MVCFLGQTLFEQSLTPRSLVDVISILIKRLDFFSRRQFCPIYFPISASSPGLPDIGIFSNQKSQFG